MASKFFTNANDRNLFDKFIGITEHMKDLYAFHAVVGYFRSSGYFALQPYLTKIKVINAAYQKLREKDNEIRQNLKTHGHPSGGFNHADKEYKMIYYV